MKILIMGATGNAGSQAIKHLKAKGIRPVAAVRDLDKAKEKLGNDLDFVYFDYFKPETYETALDGIDKIFFIAPPPTKDPAVIRAITEVAKGKGVSFMLFQSGKSTGHIEGKPLNEIENDLKASGMGFCIIRPCWYMQNFHTWMGSCLDDNELCLPTGKGKVAFIDLQDLGAAIAEILSGEGHNGKMYLLTGAEALDHGQVADILAETTGRPIVHNDLSEEDFVAKMMDKGVAEKPARYTAWLFGRVKGGSEEEVLSDLQEILGRTPRNFKEFAKDEFGA